MTQPTYYTQDGVPVFVDRVQFDGHTYPDERYEVYTAEDGSQVARSFMKDESVPCAVPERGEVKP